MVAVALLFFSTRHGVMQDLHAFRQGAFRPLESSVFLSWCERQIRTPAARIA